MNITCISDTHGDHKLLPDIKGDILIHAGDLTGYGRLSEIKKLDKWFGTLDFKHIICVAGNHDTELQGLPMEIKQELFKNAHYLEDTSIELDGIKIYGSPFTPIFMNWAFMANEETLKNKWDRIPIDTDIVVTHGPMYGVLDFIDNGYNPDPHVGSKSLLGRIMEISPKYHICGHIHDARGIKTIMNMAQTKETHCVNCSVLDDTYIMKYEPIGLRY
jgi:Icc-related predicted phosphoesterase